MCMEYFYDKFNKAMIPWLAHVLKKYHCKVWKNARGTNTDYYMMNSKLVYM